MGFHQLHLCWYAPSVAFLTGCELFPKTGSVNRFFFRTSEHLEFHCSVYHVSATMTAIIFLINLHLANRK